MHKEDYGRYKWVGLKECKRVYGGFFVFDSWLSSKKSSEAEMVFGAYMVGIVKRNTKGFCKGTI